MIMTDEKRLMQGIVSTDVMKRIVVKATYHAVGHVNESVCFDWDAERDGYSSSLSGRFVTVATFRHGLSNRLDVTRWTCRLVVPNGMAIGEGYCVQCVSRHEAMRETWPVQYRNRFDLWVSFRDGRKSYHDRIRFSTGFGSWNGRYDLVPAVPDIRHGRYDSITDFPSLAVTGRFSSYLGNIRLKNSFSRDALRYWTKDRLIGKYDLIMPVRRRYPIRMDSLRYWTVDRLSGIYDSEALFRLSALLRWDSFRYWTKDRLCAEYDKGMLVRLPAPLRWDSLRYWIKDRLFGKYDEGISVRLPVPLRWDSLRYWTKDRLYGQYDRGMPVRLPVPLRWDSLRYWTRDRLNGGHDRGMLVRLSAPLRWDSFRYWTKDRLSAVYDMGMSVDGHLYCRYTICHGFREQCSSRFDVAGTPNGRCLFLFDALEHTFDLHVDKRRCDRQAFVRSGWRILAKNIENDESFDLGFVDADAENPALEGVFLPDGDYEVSILTSSLFWKDCMDREVRTISVRPGGEITPLPTIYNLRSAVLEGVTTIRWSANRSELDDCVFGVWYDSQSPVDTNRPPDATIWYYSSQTEYTTTFYQNAPVWVAVAAMRTGNDVETGKVHELYLDWLNVPPRRPDDVVVLDVPLSAFDPEIQGRNADDPNWSLWNG